MWRSLFLSVVCVLALNDLAQDAPQLAPDTVTVPVGGTATLTVTPAGAVTFPPSEFLDVKDLQLKGLKAGEVTLIGDQGGKKTNTVKVVVEPVTVKIPELKEPMLEGEKRAITVQVLNPRGGALTLPVQIKSAATDVVRVSDGFNEIEATSSEPGNSTTTLTVTANGVTLATFAVVVWEPVDSIQAPPAVEVEEGASRELAVKLMGTRGTAFTPAERPLTATVDGPPIITASADGLVQAKFLAPGSPDSTKLQLSSTARPPGGQIAGKTVDVTVRFRAGSIDVGDSTPILPREGTLTLTPRVRDRQGNPLEIKTIKWKLKDQANEAYVQLAETGKKVLAIWKGEANDPNRPKFVELIVDARTSTDSVITDSVILRLSGEIAGFAPLKVRLNIMDDQTATDLYGKKTAEEYFVTRVRLNNNLDASDDPNVQGASILAFSESIEVAVEYEKQKSAKETNLMQRTFARKPRDDKKDEWTKVDKKDIYPFNGIDGFDEPPIDRRCGGFLTYRPYMFEMMVNTVDRRDERSTRSKVLRTLQAVGTLASVVTSVAVPGPQSDIPLGIEKYSSLFIPGFEKLWPTLRETHRQNLVSQTMKTIEEIPFGSDLSRVLFFPKRPFRGLIRDYETRVSRICPFHFNIEVAIIKKANMQTIQAQTEN